MKTGRPPSHGMSYTKFHDVWKAMKNRCSNPKHQSFYRYGARGISVCDEWLVFENFRDDMLPTYVEGLDLDRIDNNAGYSKENCRWATRLVSMNNRSNTVFVVLDGERMPLTKASEITGVSQGTLLQRIKKRNLTQETGLFKKTNRLSNSQQPY